MWKSEYENAYQLYQDKINTELKQKREENKNKKKMLIARESVAPAVNNLIKKKSNNTNTDLRATGNFNYENNMNYNKRFSITKDSKK